MSDYEFYAGFEGAGDDGTHAMPDSLFIDGPAGDDHNLNNLPYEDAEWGPADGPDAGYEAHEAHEAHETYTAHDTADHEDIEATGYEGAGFEHTEHGDGLLDGLEFDLDGLDLGSLTDMAFDARYDLIGSDPAEHSWWQDLASDHNHDGAYETISADDPYAAL
jgi:hypothetical protein